MNQIAFPLLIRIAAALVFPVTVAVAAILNRSFLMVPLLALAATGVQLLMSRVAPNPLTSFGAMAQSGPKPVSLNTTMVTFFIGACFYAGVFILFVFLSALFQETQLAHGIAPIDFVMIAIPSALAALFSFVSSRLAAAQVTDLMQQFQSGLNPDGAGRSDFDPDDGMTIDGKVIDPDETTTNRD